MSRVSHSEAALKGVEFRSLRSSALDDWAYDLARLLAKSVFAGADLFLGPWPGPRILIYHQVVADPVRQMDIAPGAFIRQMDWLSEHGRIVDLETALSEPVRAESRSDYVLTFDDGYRGMFDFAFPILRERRIPFTLYLTSGFIGHDTIPGINAETLDWDHVGEMLSSGSVTLGAHTHTHPDLRLLTAGQIEEELGESNRLIERHTGRRPLHFAYPKGYWSAAAEPIVRDLYHTAAVGAGPAITEGFDPFRLTRLPVQSSDGVFFFRRKMLRGMRMEEWLRSRLKGYRNPASDSQQP